MTTRPDARWSRPWRRPRPWQSPAATRPTRIAACELIRAIDCPTDAITRSGASGRGSGHIRLIPAGFR